MKSSITSMERIMLLKTEKNVRKSIR